MKKRHRETGRKKPPPPSQKNPLKLGGRRNHPKKNKSPGLTNSNQEPRISESAAPATSGVAVRTVAMAGLTFFFPSSTPSSLFWTRIRHLFVAHCRLLLLLHINFSFSPVPSPASHAHSPCSNSCIFVSITYALFSLQ